MIRKIIAVDKERCSGCGLCAKACHEGAIAIIGGKAVLTRDDYCDALGDCLPTCPQGAISFIEREAPAYDPAAAKAHKEAKPDAQAREAAGSSLANWPVQIRLAPVRAPYYHQADLLIAADCTAYACSAFHQRYAGGHTVLIGCPKLDDCDYAEKLAAIIGENDIASLTVVKMEVPCCVGLEMAVSRALALAGKDLAIRTATIGIDGEEL